MSEEQVIEATVEEKPAEQVAEKPAPKRRKPKLDLQADYAEVRGAGIKARYLQDGEYFGPQGEPLGKKLV